ncbi:MAG: TonB-dependent receptor [Bacteroidales bacterium]|nr:TonB-dependent receptor [Bacteroidales bacterium]
MRSRLKLSKWKIAIVCVALFSITQSEILANNPGLTSELRQETVTGNVTDADGNSLPGVNVLIKGTTVGTTTDISGNFSIKANIGDILVFSYVGFREEELTVPESLTMAVMLEEDILGLDEIVVIGYGVQKKKLNTGATLNIDGEELQRRNTTDAMSSLQGISPGVSITKESGRPGAGTKVYIRGMGTIQNAAPLYVVDGIQVDDIDYLSPADIESIDVLKDAASSAIYGSQAANGVVLVTTKKGKKGKETVISYDAYFGWQNVAKNPNMLNAKDYAYYMNEQYYNSTGDTFDFALITPDWENIQNGSNEGTNWFDEFVNENAVIQSHTLNITGSSERSSYAAGASYLYDEGLLGKQTKSDYERITLRLNSDHILKEFRGHSLVTFGENFTYTHNENPSVADGNLYWNDLRSMLTACPFMPVYYPDGEYHYALDGRDDEHYDNLEYWSNSPNPIAFMDYEQSNNENSHNRIVGNAYFELEPIKNLKLRSSFGVNSWWGSTRIYVPEYDIARQTYELTDRVNQSTYQGYTWIWTNTVSYSFNLFDDHNLSVLVGQEAQKNERSLELEAENRESNFGDFEHAYIDNVSMSNLTYINMRGRDDYGWAMSSYFGRLSYDFRETYLFTYVYRLDGSSNFAPEYRFDDFHSVSAGWILSQENFMESIPQISYLKIRGSWGQNGNQDIYPPFQDVAQISYEDAGYMFGTDRTVTTTGSGLLQLPNPLLVWETSVQTDVGLDMNLFNNRLQSSFDWYKKTTKDWLVDAPALLIFGSDAPFINGGTIENKGVELMLKWTEQRSDFRYSITATMAHNKNKVTNINNSEKIIHGVPNVLSHGTSEMYRAEVGYPVGYFWGYETDGIIQNDTEAEIYLNSLTSAADAYAATNGTEPVYDETLTEENLVPGELRFVDQNGDGLINDDDKVMIGDPNPDYIFGLTINLEYKNAYLEFAGVGKAGHQIAQSWRSFTDGPKQNMSYDYAEATWHETRNPDGTLPRLTSVATASTRYMSDIYIHDADYFRISNLTIGYDFSGLIKWGAIRELRLYVSAQNLYTFTKYNGMDPEVGYGPDSEEDDDAASWASGFDLGLYPQSRTYMIGLSVKF